MNQGGRAGRAATARKQRVATLGATTQFAKLFAMWLHARSPGPRRAASHERPEGGGTPPERRPRHPRALGEVPPVHPV
eukprot:7620245-Alexandrium_andersonii.AAC.1